MKDHPRSRAFIKVLGMWFVAVAFGALTPTAAAIQSATPDPQFQTLLLSNGSKLPYRVLLPEFYSESTPTPVLIALPPGDQSRAMVEAGVARYWSVGPANGWVVISPAASDGISFVDLPEGLFAEFLDAVTTLYPAEAGKVHLAGVSNGGRSCIRLATLMPSRFQSVIALPGFAPTADDFERLHAITSPVRIIVGEKDTKWVKEASATIDRLQSMGKDALIEVRHNEGHLVSVTGEELFAKLNSLRPAGSAVAAQPVPPVESTAATPSDNRAQVTAVLDAFHTAAATADGAAYFACFAPQGIFLGTDDSERWTVDQFRAYAEPYFSQGKGWKYTPSDRHIDFTADGSVAWFDEKLDNEKYGRCRGSGVMLLIDGAWKIAQYNLTVPIPNDMLADVAKAIREAAMPKAEPKAE